MAYNQQHIDTINKLKPDLKGFDPMSITEEMARAIISTDPKALAILKFELCLLEYSYRESHAYIYFKDWINKKFFTNFLGGALLLNSVQGYTKLHYFNKNNPVSLVEHLDNPTKYMTSYLARKYKAEYGLTKSSKLNIKIEENEFSYSLVEAKLKGKSLNSTQVKGLMEQIRTFNNPIKDKFKDLFISKCKLPSIALQRELKDFYGFPSLDLSKLRWRYSKSIISMDKFWDARDSDYNPFVLGLTKQPITNSRNMERLIQVAIIMNEEAKPEDQPMLEGVLDYLTIPEHKQDIQDKYIPQLEAAKLTISNLIGALNGRI